MQKKSPIKERILETLANKGFTRYEFYKKTGITRGVLDKENGISEENIAKFLAYFSDINITWLITGRGTMFIEKPYMTEEDVGQSVVSESGPQYGSESKNEVIDLQRKYIQMLENEIAMLKSQNPSKSTASGKLQA